MSALAEYEAADKWYDRVKVMSLYHYKKMQEEDKWYIKDTADYFNISTSTVAENLAIAKRMNELRNIGSRNKALKKLRGIKI